MEQPKTGKVHVMSVGNREDFWIATLPRPRSVPVSWTNLSQHVASVENNLHGNEIYAVCLPVSYFRMLTDISGLSGLFILQCVCQLPNVQPGGLRHCLMHGYPRNQLPHSDRWSKGILGMPERRYVLCFRPSGLLKSHQLLYFWSQRRFGSISDPSVGHDWRTVIHISHYWLYLCSVQRFGTIHLAPIRQFITVWYRFEQWNTLWTDPQKRLLNHGDSNCRTFAKVLH